MSEARAAQDETAAQLRTFVSELTAFTSNADRKMYLFMALAALARSAVTTGSQTVDARGIFSSAVKSFGWPSYVDSPEAWGLDKNRLPLFVKVAREMPQATLAQIVYLTEAAATAAVETPTGGSVRALSFAGASTLLEGVTLSAPSGRSLDFGAEFPNNPQLHDVVPIPPISKLPAWFDWRRQAPGESPLTDAGGPPFVATIAAPLTVWVYGDGMTARMLSELQPLLEGTKLTVIGKANPSRTFEQSGPGPDPMPNGQTLLQRIEDDFNATSQLEWPNVVLIGYAASALSYVYCSGGVPAAKIESAAVPEAYYILEAAAYLQGKRVTVLLTKGAGSSRYQFGVGGVKVPVDSLPGAPPEFWECMKRAYEIVAGFTASSGFENVDWSLDTENPLYWNYDTVHLSCDPDRYQDPTGVDSDPCAIYNDHGELTHHPPRADVMGALEVATRVKAALQRLQRVRLPRWRVST